MAVAPAQVLLLQLQGSQCWHHIEELGEPYSQQQQQQEQQQERRQQQGWVCWQSLAQQPSCSAATQQRQRLQWQQGRVPVL
jgi:hypothetical protein